MPLPTPGQYSQAVQNPSRAFEESFLRISTVVKSSIGLPKAMTGNFAVVFRLNSGVDSWAIRCNFRPVPEISHRYAAISDYIAPHLGSSSSLVSFRHLRNGVRVDGVWYPIIVMRWLDALTLDTFIERHLSSPESLRRLAESWLQLDAELSRLGIAHGDLQHGNVLVLNGALKLIDYDGMFVPSLKGLKGNERGHPNYQHPWRSGADFGPDMDNFSSLLIYVAIQALIWKPELWNKYRMPEDALLFRKSDLDEPNRSELFAELVASSDVEIAALATALRNYLVLDQPTPRLNVVLSQAILARKSVAPSDHSNGASVHASTTDPASLKSWWAVKDVKSTPKKESQLTDVETESKIRVMIGKIKWWDKPKNEANASSQPPTKPSDQSGWAWGQPVKPAVRSGPSQAIQSTSNQGNPQSGNLTASMATKWFQSQLSTPAASAPRVPSNTPSAKTGSPAPATAARSTHVNNTWSAKTLLIGSRTSKKFHLPTCSYAAGINHLNLIHLTSISEARQQGYVACKLCRPDQATYLSTSPSAPVGGVQALVGRTVTVRFSDGTKETVRLVPAGARTAGTNECSLDTPLGMALFGRLIGEVVSYLTRNGRVTLDIESIV